METTDSRARQQGAQNPGTTNPTDRPTFADLMPMMADAAQGYAVMHHDNGTMDDEETANDLLERVGVLAEELALSDISATQLCDLMEVVNEYAVTAHDIARQGKANNAAAALRQIITTWGLMKDYRPELWQFSNATAQYSKAIRAANRQRAAAPLNAETATAQPTRRTGVIHFTEADAKATDTTTTQNTPER